MKPNAEESRSDLTFDWSLRESRVRSLFYAFAFALAGGLAALVIFQVTTAVNKKPQAPSQAIVILDPSSLAAQHLIDRANDQSYLLLADNAAHEQTQATLAEASPVFEPGFKNFQLKLRDLGQAQAPEMRPRLFSAAHALLPPLSLPQASTPPPATEPAASARPVARLFAEVSEELRARWQPRPQAIPEALMQMNGRLTYRLAVDSLGCVTTALLLDEPAVDATAAASTTTGADAEALQRYVRSLRFKPDSEAKAPQWAMLTISWQREPRP